MNVPLFRLWATDPRTGDEPFRMNVVVGKSLNHKTPLLARLGSRHHRPRRLPARA